MFLFIHEMIDNGDDQLRHDLKHIFLFEVSGGVGHDHGDGFFEEMEKPFNVVLLTKIHWKPMGHSLIC